jgi:hypothetical protein
MSRRLTEVVEEYGKDQQELVDACKKLSIPLDKARPQYSILSDDHVDRIMALLDNAPKPPLAATPNRVPKARSVSGETLKPRKSVSPPAPTKSASRESASAQAFASAAHQDAVHNPRRRTFFATIYTRHSENSGSAVEPFGSQIVGEQRPSVEQSIEMHEKSTVQNLDRGQAVPSDGKGLQSLEKLTIEQSTNRSETSSGRETRPDASNRAPRRPAPDRPNLLLVTVAAAPSEYAAIANTDCITVAQGAQITVPRQKLLNYDAVLYSRLLTDDQREYLERVGQEAGVRCAVLRGTDLLQVRDLLIALGLREGT